VPMTPRDQLPGAVGRTAALFLPNNERVIGGSAEPNKTLAGVVPAPFQYRRFEVAPPTHRQEVPISPWRPARLIQAAASSSSRRPLKPGLFTATSNENRVQTQSQPQNFRCRNRLPGVNLLSTSRTNVECRAQPAQRVV
jgi:hypothetical protein